MRNQLKKLGIISISCLLALSSAMSSMAAVNGTGGGEVSTDSQIDWIGNFWKLHINQGVRFTIVNQEGVAVVAPVDVVSYFPEDITSAIGQTGEDVAMLWNDYKDNTGKRFGVHKDFILYLGGCKTDLTYSYVGCAFDKSRFSEDGLAEDAKKNGVLGIQRTEYTRDGEFLDFVDGKMYTYSLIEACLNRDAEKFGYENPVNGTNETYSYVSASGEQRTIHRRFLNPVQEGLTSSGVVGLYGTGEEMKNQLMAPVTVDGETYTVIERMLEMDVVDMNGRGNLKSTEAVKMFEYIDPSLKAQYDALVAEGTVNAMSKVFRDNNLRLLIEDIHWCVPYVMSPLDPYGNTGTMYQSAYSTPTIIYGTTTQALYYTMYLFNKQMGQEGNYLDMPDYMYDFSNFCDWIEGKGIGIDWNWDLGDEAYMLAEDATDLGLYRYDENTQDKLSNFVRWHNQLGYGVMVTRLDEEPTGTSTFDEEVYGENTSEGYRRGPSEEKITEGGSEQQNNIVKFYAVKNEDDEYVYIDNNFRNQTVSPVVLENEVQYKVDNWFVSKEYQQPVEKDESYSDYKNQLGNEESGTGLGTVQLEPTETLYVRLVEEKKAEQQIVEIGQSGLVLHENEISHNFGLDNVTGSLLSTVREYSSVNVPSCSYEEPCDCDDEDGCSGGHDCNGTMSEVDAGNYSFDIHNKYNYNKQFVWKWEEANTEYSGAGGGHNGFDVEAVPDMDMVLSRSFSDKPTLYKGLNSEETKSLMVNMGITAEGYQPAGQRYDGKSNQENRVTWTGDFKTDWQYENVDNPDIEFEHGGHDEKTKTQSSSGSTTELNEGYSSEGNVTIYGLWGKANSGLKVPDDKVRSNKWTVGGLNFISVRAHIEDTANIEFYPYYKMVYQDMGTEDKAVYLTAENLSKLLNVQRVDTSMLRTGAARGLELQSYQWQIHRKVQSGIASYGVQDMDSVLPAGAVYQLRTGNSSDQASDTWVGLRIFSTYVEDKSKLVKVDGILNKSEAQSKISDFKGQVERVLEGYEIVMNGAVGISTDEDGFYEESRQITGQVGDYKIGGQKFDSDSKYDLQSYGSGANRSDLDVLEVKSEQYDWKLIADTDGNISIYRNDSLLEVIPKGSKKIGNAEVKDLDERTKMVSNFIKALDRNLGSDRNGESWYNEGFEICCIEDRVAYRIGFGGGQEIRSAALNIKAGGLLENRDDLYNMERSTIEQKARTYKFYTSQRSTVAEAAGHRNGWIGNFGDTEIIVPGINGLLTSKPFYSSNGTVNDLN